MEYKPKKLLKILDHFDKSQIEHTVEKNEHIYYVKGDRWRFHVTIDTKRWLGIEFGLSDEWGEPLIGHFIDTDIYPPSDDGFYEEIESDIIGLIEALVGDRILIGTVKGRPAMILPPAYLIRRVRFLGVVSEPYKTLEEAKSRGDFHPFIFKGKYDGRHKIDS